MQPDISDYEVDLSCFDENTLSKFTNSLNSEENEMTYSEFLNVVENEIETEWLDNYVSFVYHFVNIGYTGFDPREINSIYVEIINQSPYLTNTYILKNLHIPLRFREIKNSVDGWPEDESYEDDDHYELTKTPEDEDNEPQQTIEYVVKKYQTEKLNTIMTQHVSRVLSSNSKMTWDLVMTHPDLPWNISLVSETPICCETLCEEILMNLPLNLLKQELNGTVLCSNTKISPDFIFMRKKQDGWNWNWDDVSTHPDLEVRHLEMARECGIKLNMDFICYTINRITFQQMLDTKDTYCWNWCIIAKGRPNVGFKEIIDNSELNWNLSMLTSIQDGFGSKKPFIVELIDAFPNTHWDMSELTLCVTEIPHWCEVIKKHPHLDWDFELISALYRFNLNLIDMFPRANWLYNGIVSNNISQINDDFIIKYGDRIKGEPTWSLISNGFRSKVTLKFMISTIHRYPWDMEGICTHPDMTMNIAFENSHLLRRHDILCNHQLDNDYQSFMAQHYRRWFVKCGLMRDLMEHFYHPRNFHKIEDFDLDF
jgi:hypothetical protein